MPHHMPAPRHRASASSRIGVAIGGILSTVAAIAGASILGVLTAGSSYAMVTSSAALPGGTIRSGSLSLTVNDVAGYALSGAAWSRLLPGDTVQQQITLTNTGTVPGTVTALTTGGYGPLLVHVAKGACTTTIPGASSTVSPTNLGSLAAGEASAVCVQVSLPSTVDNTVQGSMQDFTITFTSTSAP